MLNIGYEIPISNFLSTSGSRQLLGCKFSHWESGSSTRAPSMEWFELSPCLSSMSTCWLLPCCTEAFCLVSSLLNSFRIQPISWRKYCWTRSVLSFQSKSWPFKSLILVCSASKAVESSAVFPLSLIVVLHLVLLPGFSTSCPATRKLVDPKGKGSFSYFC